MGARFGAVAQALKGIAGVEMTSRIHLLGGKCSCEQLDGLAMVAGTLRDQTREVQGFGVIGFDREDVAAILASLLDASHRVGAPSGCCKVGHVNGRREDAAAKPPERLPLLLGGSTFFSVHVAISRERLGGADIQPLALTTKKNQRAMNELRNATGRQIRNLQGAYRLWTASSGHARAGRRRSSVQHLGIIRGLRRAS